MCKDGHFNVGNESVVPVCRVRQLHLHYGLVTEELEHLGDVHVLGVRVK